MDKAREFELQNLREFAKTIIISMKNIPFNSVVEAVTGFKILPVDLSLKDDKVLINSIANTANNILKITRTNLIIANRSNDVGKPLEDLFLTELGKFGVKVGIPKTSKGRKQTAGYPDFQLEDQNGKITYVEIKNSQPEKIYKASARNFFFKASKYTKITHDARHLILSFINKQVREKQWQIIGWKLVDLYNLKVDFKPEFNVDNPRIYTKENIILEGMINDKGEIKVVSNE